MSETVQTRAGALVDEGIWDVPGVGLVKGKHLTLEYAKLALALYGAKERAIRRRAAHTLRAVDARGFGELVALDDEHDDDQDDDGDALVDAAGNVSPRSPPDADGRPVSSPPGALSHPTGRRK